MPDFFGKLFGEANFLNNFLNRKDSPSSTIKNSHILINQNTTTENQRVVNAHAKMLWRKVLNNTNQAGVAALFETGLKEFDGEFRSTRHFYEENKIYFNDNIRNIFEAWATQIQNFLDHKDPYMEKVEILKEELGDEIRKLII